MPPPVQLVVDATERPDDAATRGADGWRLQLREVHVGERRRGDGTCYR